jgi:putative oxidoreductase
MSNCITIRLCANYYRGEKMDNKKLFNLSMLVLRAVIGGIIAIHGAQKLFGMFNGIGLEGTVKMVEGLGFSNPEIVALVWANIEFIGGTFLVLGILARWSAIAVMFTVLVHLWKVYLMYGAFTQSIGMEYDILLIGACVPLILLGGGSWSAWDV